MVDAARAAEMKASAGGLASLTLDGRGLCDLELLAVGGFSPLRGFLGRADYERVVAEGRLGDGTSWPLPVTLPVGLGEGAEVGQPLALRDVYGNLLAFLHVEEIYPYDKAAEARGAYGTVDTAHPAVARLERQPPFHAAGRLEVIRTPPHHDFVDLRRTPAELRERFAQLGWSKVVAFQPRGPIHRAQEEWTKRASRRVGGGLLIHPVVGAVGPGDFDHYTRVRCDRAVVDRYYEPGSAVLGLLPLASRSAGPREALLGAIVARNYGCTHLIVEPDHAGPDPDGRPSYAPGAAIEALAAHAEEIGVGLVEAGPMAYLPATDAHVPLAEVPEGAEALTLSPAQARDDYLARGVPLPAWFARPEVAAILLEANPPRHRRGLTIWFTGLSGSGKSTVAHALVGRLAEYGRYASTLDGDEIRTHLSRGLGFSQADREANVDRVGYVAGLVARHGGTTLCSVISPYRAPRERARSASQGRFIEVYCDTPIEVCEARDVKGLYARARTAVAEGQGLGFTGVDDPYEPPTDPEVTLDTSKQPVEECVDAIIAQLIALGYLRPQGHAPA